MKQPLHIAGFLVGALALSALTRFAAFGTFFGTLWNHERESIQWLAAAAVIFISGLAFFRWKGTAAACMAMTFIAAVMIVGGWPS